MFKLKTIYFMFFIFIMGCESPMNNRVLGQPDALVAEELSFAELSLSVEPQWLSGPVGNININNQLLVVLRNSLGRLTSLPQDMSLNFYATMPSMGHPMDDAGYFEEIDTGIYLNKTIRYNMGGDWRNELWLMDADFNIKEKVLWHEFF